MSLAWTGGNARYVKKCDGHWIAKYSIAKRLFFLFCVCNKREKTKELRYCIISEEK